MNTIKRRHDMSKKSFIGFISFIVLGLEIFLLPSEGYPEVDFNVGIGISVPPPSAVLIPAPPPVYLIPSTHIYFAPNVGFELFFHSGYWYSLHDGNWFRAAYYNGPWYYLPPSHVPVVFKYLPHNYYRVYAGQRLIPYGQLKKQWREWDSRHYREERQWRNDQPRHWDPRYRGWRN
jgi:hypothetical protein